MRPHPRTEYPEIMSALRPDLAAIAEMIAPNSRVLDVGCGDGALLEHLAQTRNVDGRGIELSQQNVNQCVARGLSVVQGDADTDLAEYPSQVFDVVILSQTIQATRSPSKVLGHLLRIGRRTVVSFPNFGHWRVRLSLLLNGRMPRTHALDFPWHETPNIHLCTIADFTALAAQSGAEIERALALGANGTRAMQAESAIPNLMAEGAIFLMKPARRRT
jgi:methionine biosynthesis protein MetW